MKFLGGISGGDGAWIPLDKKHSGDIGMLYGLAIVSIVLFLMNDIIR